MIERHLAKLRARHDISDAEEQAIRGAVGEPRKVAADTTLIRRGQEIDASTLILEGLMCRHKDLRNGERQITELHVAGDFADLHSFTLKRLDHDMTALTDCTVAMVPHERLRKITEQHPHLMRVYWFGTNLDAAIHREWTLSLGRRSALARMANLFCELHVRLGIVGLSDESGFALSITQGELSECLGITTVHVNRTLKELRERKVAEFRGGNVTIRDLGALRQIAEFDPSYLYLDRFEI